MHNVNSTSITESVKHGDFEAVSIGTLEKISADWVRRASDRVQSAIKSQERKNALIWTKGLLFKMHKMGIRGRCLNWTRAFLYRKNAAKQQLLNGSSDHGIVNGIVNGME